MATTLLVGVGTVGAGLLSVEAGLQPMVAQVAKARTATVLAVLRGVETSAFRIILGYRMGSSTTASITKLRSLRPFKATGS